MFSSLRDNSCRSSWYTYSVTLNRINGEYGLELNRFARVRRMVTVDQAVSAGIQVFDRITHVNGAMVFTTMQARAAF